MAAEMIGGSLRKVMAFLGVGENAPRPKPPRRRLQFEALEARALLANQTPFAPVIMEPTTAGAIVSPSDVHMEIGPFSDPDAGNTQTAAEWQIWTTSGTIQSVWAATPVGGVEMVHLHLGDGAFQNSLAGKSALLANTDYQLRVRVRDSSGEAATQWSPISTRTFHTGPLSQVFPLELDDVAAAPAPTWAGADGGPLALPTGITPASITLESAAGNQLLRIQGFDGVSNQFINPGPLANHVELRVRVSAGNTGVNLALPQSNISFSDDHGVAHTIYLPAVLLTPGQEAIYWVAQSGATYVGAVGQTEPDFSTPARGGPVPWSVAPGYQVDVVSTGYQLPVNIAFVPNPGPNPTDPYYYVTELYGTIKVVSRNGTVSNYATNLLNFNPTGDFPGSGEQGLSGIVVDPVTGDIFATMVYSSVNNVENVPHYPKVVRFHSNDGGRTAATQTTILNMVGENQGQSHFISNISIGPDGKLYVHNGDGFDASTALNLNSFRGKILRMNFDGTAPSDNPMYNAGNGISATDYIFAYGVRNPFGGAWRASDGKHYSVEVGPSVDRMTQVNRGVSYGWNGSDASMTTNALYNWSNPSTAPTNITFVQPSTFGGSAFPTGKQGHAFVALSGPTYAPGPQNNSKSIVEFTLNANGTVAAGPTTFVSYSGTGQATVVGLTAGPDGLYFTDLYKDQDAETPIDAGANVLRVRFVGSADFTANVQQGVGRLAVQFTDTSTAPGATAWLWEFGDGTTSTLRNPSHTYSYNGEYSVRLTVTGQAGIVTTRKQDFILVGPQSQGLQATYYDNINFTGTTVSRIDPTVNFNWGTAAPVAGIGADTYSVRWTGQVQPEFSQTYTFYTRSDDGVRLYVNNQLIINNFTDHSATENSGTIALVAGQKYDIRMEFYENAVDAVATLSWSSASRSKQIIPQNRLFTTAPDVTGPTGTITPVSPDPRTTPVNQLTISFNEPVLGLELTDLRLTRNSGANLLTSAQTLTTTDHVTYTLGNLTGLTGASGAYRLTLTAAGSGIVDGAGNALANSPIEDFTINAVDTTNPTASITPVSPDPRSTPVGQMTIVMSEPVSGVNLADFAFTRDGGANLLTASQTLTTADNITFTLGNLTSLTSANGAYRLTLNAAGSGIVDGAGNPLANSPLEDFTISGLDLTNPTATITPVSPDPSTTPVSQITIVMSEAVSGVNLADFTFTRNGGANLLTASQTLTTTDNITFTLGNLAGLTGVNGAYRLTLTAAGSGIVDGASNPLANSPIEDFTVAIPDTTNPTATITPVSPDPRTAPVSQITIVMSEAVSGVDLADLTLTRNGGANLLTASQTLTTTDNITYTLGNLTGLTGAAGAYRLTLTAAGSGIVDGAGNPLANSPFEDFTVNAVTVSNGLTGVYFDNMNFTGTSITRVDSTVNFNWGTGSPSPSIGADTFSVRWTGQVQPEFTQTYTFYTTSDDGVRLTVNGQLIINNFTNHSATENSSTIALVAGQKYDILMEYFENGVDAVATLSWSSPSRSKQIIPQNRLFSTIVDTTNPTATITPVSPDPRSTAVNQMTIVMSEPVSGVDLADFTLTRDGGANLLTASQTLTTTDNVTFTLGNLASLTGLSGAYRLTLNAAGSGITDAAGNGLATSPVEDFTVNTAAVTNGLTAIYYDNMNFTGASVTRIDATVNFNWGTSSPVTGIGADTFSVRWTGQVQAEFSETYTFYTTSDDGVRLYVNGQLIINNFTNHSATENSGTITLVAGQKYDILMEYFDNTIDAVAMLSWSSLSRSKQVGSPGTELEFAL